MTISVCRRRSASATALSRRLAVWLLNARLCFSVSASVCRNHPFDGAPGSALLLRLRDREQFATSDSELVNLLLHDGWHIHDPAIGERVEDLITVLPGHFLAIVVLQCEVDRDVGLKLNLLAHHTSPFLAAVEDGRSRRSTSSIGPGWNHRSRSTAKP